MSGVSNTLGNKLAINKDGLDKLIHNLAANGYQVLGPVVRDNAIVYDEIAQISDLPTGWTDTQESAFYRLSKRQDQALFGYNSGPHSWKKYLHPASRCLLKARRDKNTFQIEPEEAPAPKMAFIGVRPCELQAISRLEEVLGKGVFTDPSFVARRKNLFIAAVNCSQAGKTCFCHSMNTGPAASSGFDLALTEILADGEHYFVAEIGSSIGAEIFQDLPARKADEKALKAVEQVKAATVAQMGRTLDTRDMKEMLFRNHENPEWDNVAARCLSCGNCTMVCPTCFCTTIEDTTDLAGRNTERWQKWDSCFTADFSYIHGGSIRPSAKARYRQMVTHKLAAWCDQFGSFGCVGCGRCITWCPAAIDITEEVRALRTGERTEISSVTLKES